MYHLSHVINQVYNQFLPLASQKGIAFGLDFPDSTLRVTHPSAIKKSLQSYLSTSIDYNHHTIITLKITPTQITIRDTGFLPPHLTDPLINSATTIKTRVGFGTTFTITF